MIHRRVRLLRTLALALVCAAGCRGGSGSGGATGARDSAGVRIVESRRAEWGDQMRWTVEPEPALQIGMVDGPAEYQLSAVGGAVRLADGGVVVANGGSHQLRYYGPDGRFLRAAGRQGGGPGEFQTVDALVPYRGDSVAAWDARQRRLSVFGPDGGFGRAATAQLEGVSALLRGAFPDGSVVLEPTPSVDAFLRMESGERRDSVSYVRYTATGQPADTLARLADRELLASREGTRISQQTLLFGRDSYFAAGGGRAYAGESDAFRVDAFDPGGTKVMSIRRPVSARAPTRAETQRARAAAEARRRDTEARAARIAGVPVSSGAAREVPARPTVPAFDQLLVDAEGNLWVRDYQVDAAQPARWQVFAPDGRWLGGVDVPPGLTVYQIGREWMLARARDELDVEYVRLYRLSRG